jgi:hypothetical protein
MVFHEGGNYEEKELKLLLTLRGKLYVDYDWEKVEVGELLAAQQHEPVAQESP